MASRGKDWIRISWHRFDDYPIRVSDGLNRWLFAGRLMIGRRVALLAGLTLSLVMIGASVGYLISDSSGDGGAIVNEGIFDPLLQEEMEVGVSALKTLQYLNRRIIVHQTSIWEQHLSHLN